MNDLVKSGEVVSHVPSDLELQSVDDTALLQQIREAVGMTETAIRRLASLWTEAMRRGIDLSDLRFALAPFLPAVARGSLIPALVVSMAGQTRSLQRLAELPTDTQQDLADGQTVPIYRPDRGVVQKTLKQLSYPELVTAIRSGRILSAEEQKMAIAKRPIRQARKSQVVEIRLAMDTYNDAARAAADAGMRLDDYLRRLILAGMRV